MIVREGDRIKGIIEEKTVMKTKCHRDTEGIHRKIDQRNHVNHVIMIVIRSVNRADTIRMIGITTKAQATRESGTKGYPVICTGQ